MNHEETMEIDVIVTACRGKVVFVEYEGVEYGLPLSQINSDSDFVSNIGMTITIEVPEWLLIDRGMV
jgi:hypothetical protein